MKLSTTNDARIKHQQLLAQLMRPATLSLLEKAKVREGSSALCLNCGEGDLVFHLSGLIGEHGTVKGLDPNMENIQTARQLAHIKKMGNATFCKMEQYGTANGQQFELIHCHLPLTRFFDLAILIEGIHTQLMPGGMVLFEVVDFSGFNSIPKNFAFERLLELYSDVIRSHWGDIAFSTRLNQLLCQSGFHQAQHRYVAPTFLQGTTKFLPSLTLECIREDVLHQKLTSDDEIQILLYELNDFAQKAHSLISLPGIHQIWGHKA